MIEQALEAISRLRDAGYEEPQEIPLTQSQYEKLRMEVEASCYMVIDPLKPGEPMMFSGVPVRIVPEEVYRL